MLQMADVRSGLLAVDACLIDADDEYLVFSVRILKSTIRDNHPMLAVISDNLGPIDPGVPVRPGPLRSAKKTPAANRMWLVAGAGVLLCGSIAIALFVPSPVAALADPIELVELHIVPAVVRPTGTLEVFATSRRRRVCMSTIDRLILRKSDLVLVAHETKVAKWHAVTAEAVTQRFDMPLPAGISPGHYVYRAWVRSNCDDGKTYHQQHKDAAFEVVAVN